MNLHTLRQSVVWLGLAALSLGLGGSMTVSLSAEEEAIDDAKGTMRQVGSFGFGIVPDDDPGSRYAPTEEVAEEFRVDGLRVVFSGTVGEPSEGRGGRRWGTPISLTKLERLSPEDGTEEPESDPNR